MNWKTIGLVFRKEVRDMFRDRRVVTNAFILPIFAMLMMFQLFGLIGSSLGGKKTSTIHIVKSAGYEPFREALKVDPSMTIKEIESKDKGLKDLADGKARVVLVFPTELPKQDEAVKVDAYFTSEETTSSVALARVEALFNAANKAVAKTYLKSKSLPESVAEAVTLKPQDTAKAKGAGESIIAQMLPYILIMFIFAGGMSVASDLVAGEKERGTLETLMISPALRSEIAIGKWLSLTLFCLASAATSVISLLLGSLTSSVAKKMMFSGEVTLEPGPILGMVLVVMALALMFASIQLWLSAMAKNMREGATYLGLANLVVLMPALFSQFVGMTDAVRSVWIRFTPILNSAMAIRDVLLNKATLLVYLGPILMSLLISMIFLAMTLRLFNREQVLTRT